ncbi:MAG: hypothetical protein U0587_15590 [Candidatus Binatia bacterium]
MTIARITAVVIAGTLLAASSAGAAPRIIPSSSRTGIVMSRRDDLGHSTYKVVTSLNPKGTTDDEVIQSITASGHLPSFLREPA